MTLNTNSARERRKIKKWSFSRCIQEMDVANNCHRSKQIRVSDTFGFWFFDCEQKVPNIHQLSAFAWFHSFLISCLQSDQPFFILYLRFIRFKSSFVDCGRCACQVSLSLSHFLIHSLLPLFQRDPIGVTTSNFQLPNRQWKVTEHVLGPKYEVIINHS